MLVGVEELRTEAETVAAGIRAVSNDNSNAAYGIATVSHAVFNLKEYVRTYMHFKRIAVLHVQMWVCLLYTIFTCAILSLACNTALKIDLTVMYTDGGYQL